MSLNLSHLTDDSEPPDFSPSRPPVSDRRFRGGGRVSVSQSTGAVSVASEEQQEQGIIVATQAEGLTDRFTGMDFRVRWEANVAYINRGRVHFSVYSTSLDKFSPFTQVIAAQEIPLVLEESEENASVWLSLPFLKRDYGSGLTPTRIFAKPDATRIIKETYWSGFHYPVASGRLDFGIATTDLVPPPLAATDFKVQLAYVGFSSGVRHTHFGSVFLPHGFDAKLTRD